MKRVSKPAPPSMVSQPMNPLMRSIPAPAEIKSASFEPSSVSAPELPVSLLTLFNLLALETALQLLILVNKTFFCDKRVGFGAA
jgi:hypothetical protein